MAVISISELHDGRGGSAAIQKNKGVRKHTRVFRVETDSVFDTDQTVLRALPSLGSPHPSDPSAYCTDKSANNEGFSKTIWKATLSYSTERELDENPLDVPAAIEWSSSATQCGFAYDADGKAILNSAGDHFVDQVKGERSFWNVTITKNLALVPSWLLDYADAVNSSAVTIDGISIPKDKAKVSSIRVSKTLNSNDVSYREVQIGIKVHPDGWTKHVVDQGLRWWETSEYMDDEGQEQSKDILVPAKNDDGTQATKPVFLDGEGGPLKPPGSTEKIQPGDEQYLDFAIYPTKDFSALPLS